MASTPIIITYQDKQKKKTTSASKSLAPAQSTQTDYKQEGAGSQTNARTEGMSAGDQAALKAAGDAWTNASTKAEQDAAHAQAEAIRAKYGYSGGQDGSARVDPVTGKALGSSTNNDGVNSGYRPSYADDYARNDAADKSGVDNSYAGTAGVSQTDYQSLVSHGANYNMYAAQLEQALASASTEEERVKARGYYQPLMDAEHAAAEKIRNSYGYSGGQDGSEYLPSAAAGLGGGLSGGQVEGNNYQNLSERPELPKTPDFQAMLEQWHEVNKAQQEAKIDYATQQGITELERAEQDAREQFQTQRDQVAIDEANALDNQALYAERRGDKGGIGAVQYAAVQNAAMANRAAVNRAQVKLSTDTARQIADLRAQGEFEKADALLDLAQTYLSKLVETTKWSAEYDLEKVKLEEAIREWEAGYGLDVAKFNESIRQWQQSFNQSIYRWQQEYQSGLQQWEAEFGLSEGKLTGSYNGQPILSEQNSKADELSQAGWTLLKKGVLPNEEQLAAMGVSLEQANSFLAAGKKTSTVGGGTGESKTEDGDAQAYEEEPDIKVDPIGFLIYHGVEDVVRARAVLSQKYKEDVLEDLVDVYEEYLTKMKLNETAAYGTMYDEARSLALSQRAQGKTWDQVSRLFPMYRNAQLTHEGVEQIRKEIFGG